MKEIKEREELFWSRLGLLFATLGAICAIASMWVPEDIKFKFCWAAMGLIVMSNIASIRRHDCAIKNIKEDIANISYAINKLAENVRQELYGTDEEESEEDTKETMIVSPEDFERFKKGEMTKEELLGIKKAVDTVSLKRKLLI